MNPELGLACCNCGYENTDDEPGIQCPNCNHRYCNEFTGRYATEVCGERVTES